MGNFYGIWVLVLMSIFLVPLINCGQKIDAMAEVNKIGEKIKRFEKPSPALLENAMETVRESCKTNKTLEQTTAESMGGCVSGLFNESALVSEFESAVPKGELDNVFRSICLKWPMVKKCLSPVFNLVEECWDNGTLLNSGVESMVTFFCGADNNGALIALFFAEGGFTCFEEHGDKVKKCVNDHNTEENHENLCVSVEQLNECLEPLRKCGDSTPHNLVTSMVREVGRVMKCPPIPQKITNSSSCPKHIINPTIFIIFNFFLISNLFI